MTRTIARDRAGWTEAITMDCYCGHRLALWDEQVPTSADNALQTGEWANVSDGLGGTVAYWHVRCPRCQNSVTASEGKLLQIIRGAKAKGLHRVTAPRQAA